MCDFEPISLEDAQKVLEGIKVESPSVEIKGNRFRLLDNHRCFATIHYRPKTQNYVSFTGNPQDVDHVTRQAEILQFRSVSFSQSVVTGYAISTIPSFTTATTLDFRAYHRNMPPLTIDGERMAQLLSLTIRCRNMQQLPTGFDYLVKLRVLDLDQCELEEVPIQLARLPHLLNLSVRENPLRVAPLFLCETRLKYFHASYDTVFQIEGCRIRVATNDVDLNTLRKVYHAFCWRKEVFDLIWTNVAQPIAEELELDLTFCQCLNCNACEHAKHNMRHFVTDEILEQRNAAAKQKVARQNVVTKRKAAPRKTVKRRKK